MAKDKLPYRVASGYNPVELADSMNRLHEEGYRFLSLYSNNTLFIAVMALTE